MKLSTRRASLSIFLAMAIACVRAQDEFCCDVTPSSKNVSTMNITLKEFVTSSPHYEPIVSTDKFSVDYESVCCTYFPMDDEGNLYLEFRAIQDSSGLSVNVLLVSYLEPGVFRVQGVFSNQVNYTTVHNAYIVDASCQGCQSVFMYYKYYIYDECDFVDVSTDVVNGKSSSPDNAPSCLDAFETLAESKGFNVRGFSRPAGDSYSCVTNYRGSTCVNYENVAPENSISYPVDSSNSTSC